MARKLKRDLTVEEQLARGPVDLPFLMLVVILTGVGVIMSLLINTLFPRERLVVWINWICRRMGWPERQ